MVSKWAKNNRDWALSARQRLERDEALRQAHERQRAREEEEQNMRLSAGVVNELLHQYGGPSNIFPGSFYRNGLGCHFQLLWTHGRYTARIFSEIEQKGEFGYSWVPVFPQGQPGDDYLGPQGDLSKYEMVHYMEVGWREVGPLLHLVTGEIYNVQQQHKVKLVQGQFGLELQPHKEETYDPNRECIARRQVGDWTYMPANTFFLAQPLQLVPNLAADLVDGVQSNGFVGQDMLDGLAEAAPLPEIPDLDAGFFSDFLNGDFVNEAVPNDMPEAASHVPTVFEESQDQVIPTEEFVYDEAEMGRIIQDYIDENNWADMEL